MFHGPRKTMMTKKTPRKNRTPWKETPSTDQSPAPVERVLPDRWPYKPLEPLNITRGPIDPFTPTRPMDLDQRDDEARQPVKPWKDPD